MEKLLKVISEYGDENDLVFNPSKSAVVIYSPHEIGEEINLKIQNNTIPTENQYKYLGIVISNSRNYLNMQEKSGKKKPSTHYTKCKPRRYGGSTDSKSPNFSGKLQRYQS